jgi:hypothetical protein
MLELRLHLNSVTRVFSTAATLLFISLLPCSPAVAQESKAAPDASSAQINQRVEELLKKMTLEEKIGQLNQVSAANFLNPPNREEMIQKGEIGSFLWSVDSVQLDKYQHIAVEPAAHSTPFWLRRDSRLPNRFPGADCHGGIVGSASPGKSAGVCGAGSARQWHQLDFRSDGGHRA